MFLASSREMSLNSSTEEYFDDIMTFINVKCKMNELYLSFTLYYGFMISPTACRTNNRLY